MDRKHPLEIVEVSAGPEPVQRTQKGMVEAAFYAVRFFRWNWQRCKIHPQALHEGQSANLLRQLVLPEGALTDIRLPPIHRKPRKG